MLLKAHLPGVKGYDEQTLFSTKAATPLPAKDLLLGLEANRVKGQQQQQNPKTKQTNKQSRAPPTSSSVADLEVFSYSRKP